MRFTKNIGVSLYNDTKLNFKTISLFKKSNTHSNLLPLFIYSKPVPIYVKRRQKDLIDLLPFVPAIFHDFYQNLSTDNQANYMLPDNDEENSETE